MIKVDADLIKRVFDEDGNLEVTFKVSNFSHIRWIKELEKKPFSLEIREIKSKRSINSNKYFWALVHEITHESEGIGGDDWNTYLHLLEMANVKYEYMLIQPEAFEQFEKIYRAVIKVGKREVNGVELDMVKCFIGSSKFNQAEFSHLIEIAQNWANELGLDVMKIRGNYYE